MNRLLSVLVAMPLLVAAASTGRPRPAAVEASQLTAPLLGVVVSDSGSAMRAIEGVPDAAVVSAQRAFPGGIRSARVSPEQSWAIGVTPDDRLALIRFADGGGQDVQVIDRAMRASDPVAFSAGGRSAAVLLRAEGRVVVFGASAVHDFAISGLSAGSIVGLAVPDNAERVVAFTDDGGVWQVQAESTQLLYRGSGVLSGTFIPGGRSMAVADGSEGRIVLLEDVAGAVAVRELLHFDTPDGGRVHLTAARDGSFVLAARDGGSTVWRVPLSGDAAVDSVEAPAAVRSIAAVRNPALFILSAAQGEPAWMLVSDSTQLRTFFAAVGEE